jgi:hypothetical protein
MIEFKKFKQKVVLTILDRCSGRVFADFWNAFNRASTLASLGSFNSWSCEKLQYT